LDAAHTELRVTWLSPVILFPSASTADTVISLLLPAMTFEGLALIERVGGGVLGSAGSLVPGVDGLDPFTFTSGVELSSPPQAVKNSASDNADALARNFPDIIFLHFSLQQKLLTAYLVCECSKLRLIYTYVL
jgi:hypothetical protein